MKVGHLEGKPHNPIVNGDKNDHHVLLTTEPIPGMTLQAQQGRLGDVKFHESLGKEFGAIYRISMVFTIKIFLFERK